MGEAKGGRPKVEAKGGGQWGGQRGRPKGRPNGEAKGGGQKGGQRGRPKGEAKGEAKGGGQMGRPKGRPKGEAGGRQAWSPMLTCSSATETIHGKIQTFMSKGIIAQCPPP